MHITIQVEQELRQLLAQEDTTGNKQITIDDQGPKSYAITDIHTQEKVTFTGTYHLANLLQEIAKLHLANQATGILDTEVIFTPPVERITQAIRSRFWDQLTRRIDANGLQRSFNDEKTSTQKPILYVPERDTVALAYFKSIPGDQFEIGIVPAQLSDDFDYSVKDKPGILSLALQEKNGVISGVPFVVPGGRFNEMYGWDSYFIALGLLADDRLDLALGIAENYHYQLEHYGKILNANRSYYLSRTQPPFYAALIAAILEKEIQPQAWIEKHLAQLIHEYHTVWMQPGKRLSETGLNRYRAEGKGIPFEVEPGHFDDVLEPYAANHNLSTANFEQQYNEGIINVPELDRYFVHDRSMRESGHDTTKRYVNSCADLANVDLNSLLYQYEITIAKLVQTYCDGSFLDYSTAEFTEKAKERKNKIDMLCWNRNDGIYYDYHIKKQQAHKFASATAFYPLWAKLCSAEQAEILVQQQLPKFKMKGGLASTTAKAVLDFSADKTPRQWDYPFGWAPHQMLLWQGLQNYGYQSLAQEMAYRWLWLCTTTATHYNGLIPEKFDLALSSHKVTVEYGNVGTEFDYLANEGFGWVNASYQCGLALLNPKQREALNQLTDPDLLFD
jgi:alpha,alpha-trehalase